MYTPGSEVAIHEALFERYPRDSFTIATKLFVPAALSEGMAKKQFQTSLRRLGTDYIDYYSKRQFKIPNNCQI